MEELFAVHLTEDEVLRDLESIVDPAIEWAHAAFYYRQPEVVGNNMNDKVAVSNIVGMEELIWSPILGIKGQIDMVAKSNMSINKSYLPIELKTGTSNVNAVMIHKAQVRLQFSTARFLIKFLSFN